MAHLASAKKRIRSNEKKRIRNKYQHKTCRTYIKKLKAITVKEEAQKIFHEVVSKIDKLAKNNIIHKNKAANQKSKLSKLINKLS